MLCKAARESVDPVEVKGGKSNHLKRIAIINRFKKLNVDDMSISEIDQKLGYNIQTLYEFAFYYRIIEPRKINPNVVDYEYLDEKFKGNKIESFMKLMKDFYRDIDWL